jgi:hypothetical protein
MKMLALLATLVWCISAASPARAADPDEIHALLSLTGASAFGGQAAQTNLHSQSLEKIPCR